MKHNKKKFYYGGYTFIPIKRLTEKQLEFNTITKHLHSDRELALTTYEDTYNYRDFYEECGEKYYDLFRCEENGKIYIPCENELFEYVK